ncbi:MAG: hypothetical protein QOF66_747 [Mycobacterium sp.]|jgi:hypothetical protein|uniref:hypothetical protein n=1 Tax=Mycobacterium sp. TaxID=1785 RepID=UPI0028B3D2F8|nr:hypothetical protein [Mycobacterium sp.]
MPPGGPESAAARNYIATSNGDWAKTNDSYHDEATVRSTWTITSTCSNPVDCTGQVTSDQGWTAPILHNSDAWIVQRELPSWKRCPDGYVATGHQRYRFWPVDATGYVAVGSPMLTGEEKTTGPSGACGVNKLLVIGMPFRLDKVA